MGDISSLQALSRGGDDMFERMIEEIQIKILEANHWVDFRKTSTGRVRYKIPDPTKMGKNGLEALSTSRRR